MSERRARLRVKGPFEGRWDGAVTPSGRVVDLSVTGCFVESVELPLIGQQVHVWIVLGGVEWSFTGEVVYAELNQGFAVHFVDLRPDAADALGKEIASRLAI